MTTPESATATGPTNPAREADRVGRELHETYAVVGAAMDVLYDASGGSVHPALRQARRCGDDALELAEHARQVLHQGTARLRTGPGGQHSYGIEDLVDALTSVRTRFGAAAEQVTALSVRITDAQARLPATGRPDLTVEAVTDRWTGAADQLRLMAANLAGAVHALTSYTDELTGTGGDA